jgi:hypothetical protein
LGRIREDPALFVYSEEVMVSIRPLDLSAFRAEVKAAPIDAGLRPGLWGKGSRDKAGL